MSLYNIAINGKYHNHTNVRANVFGRTLMTMKAINYKRVDEVSPVKVVGTPKTVGHTQGNEVCSGSITLLTTEVNAIQRLLPKGKTLQDIPAFSISVAFVDESGLMVSHELIGVKFLENGVNVDSGSNDALSVEIPLFITEIDFSS